MGACSTITISREDALQIIVQCLFKADNYTIGEVLDDLVGGENAKIDYPGICLNNFVVVSQYSEDDYKPWKNGY